MPSSRDRRALVEIKDNIRFAQEWTPASLGEFLADPLRLYAVTRALEIISEASRRLDPDTRLRHSEIPWTSIAAAGNVYRHEYEEIAEHLIWESVVFDLPPLLAVVETELGDRA